MSLESFKVEVRGEFAEVRGKFAEVHAEFAAVRSEMAEMKSELRAEMAEMKSELKTEIAELRAEGRAFRDEMMARFDTLHRHFDVVLESIDDRLALFMEGWRTTRDQNGALEVRVTSLEQRTNTHDLAIQTLLRQRSDS